MQWMFCFLYSFSTLWFYKYVKIGIKRSYVRTREECTLLNLILDLAIQRIAVRSL